jgi:hypothetical protein
MEGHLRSSTPPVKLESHHIILYWCNQKEFLEIIYFDIDIQGRILYVTKSIINWVLTA